MIYRIFAAAMAAGLLAAVLISGIEEFTTTPMILEAETYESPATVIEHSQIPAGKQDHNAMSAQMGDNPSEDHAHDANAWTPENGLERFLYTVLANAVTGIAFSLLLVIGLTMGERKVDRGKGILMALAGFTAFTLAPVLGLPPELPGMPAADLQLRQVWWIVTVVMTLSGLYCIFGMTIKSMQLIGIILLMAPHVWGAPHLAISESPVPATLAAQFTASSIVISALFWGLLGYFTPVFFLHFQEKES